MKKIIWYLVFCILYLVWASPAFAASASLSLSPASGTYSVGQEFGIDVILDTGGGRTSATDAAINFDPNILQALEITPGTIYNTYTSKIIDNTSGSAKIAGLADFNNLFQGQGIFATVKFIGRSQGVASVSFDFTPGNRNDANVADIDTEGDILASANGGSYQITADGVGGPPPPTATPRPTFGPTCTPTQAPPASPEPTPQLPVTAIVSPTLVIATLSGLLFILSLYSLGSSF